MRGAYSRYRAHSAFDHGSGTTERMVKICMLAFPSIWVSWITVVLIGLLLNEDDCLVFRQSAIAYFVTMF